MKTLEMLMKRKTDLIGSLLESFNANFKLNCFYFAQECAQELEAICKDLSDLQCIKISIESTDKPEITKEEAI